MAGMMYFNVYTLPVVAAGIIMLVLAIMSYRYRSTPGVISFALLMLAGSVYSTFYALEIASESLQLVKTFYKLEYLGIPFIPAFYLLFAILYTGKAKKINLLANLAIFIIPAITIVLVYTNSLHQFFIRSGYLNKEGLFPTYAFTPGPAYWIHQAYSIFTIVASFILFFRMWLNSAPVFRKQISILLIASFVPFVVYVIYLAGAFPFGLDPIPFAFAIAGLIIYSGLTHLKLFNLAPLARNLLFEKIPNAVIVFDDQNRIVDCNQAASTLLNIGPKEMGKPSGEILEKWPGLYNYSQNNLADNGSGTLELITNGDTNYYEPMSSPLIDDRNRVQGKMLILRDVTQQRISEIKRREIEEKFRTIFENAPLGVFYFDKDGFIRVFNDYLVKIMGSTRDKIMDLNFKSIPDQRVVEAMNGALNGQKTSFEGDYYSVTGQKLTPVRAHFEAIYSDNGNLAGGFGIVQDITEQREAANKIHRKNEELQKLNAEKDRFFSIIAHDLRGPFTAFLGYTELMIDETDNLSTAELRDFALQIRKSALALYSLLENLLAWSKLQQDNFSMTPENINLHNLVANCIYTFEDNASKKQLMVHNKIQNPLHAFGDEKMISSVLRNLISNAIKFTPRNGSIIIESDALENEMIEVKVSDTGIGISKANIDKLFRIDQKTGLPGTEDEPSTGLGLILCREFIEKHGGEIRVESEPGKGSHFLFTLPVNQEAFLKNTQTQ